MIFQVVPPAQLAALANWLPRQRWYGGKGAAVTAVELVDSAALGGDAWLVLVEVQAAGLPPARYGLVLSEARLEALEEPAVRQRLWALLQAQAELPGACGRFRFEPVAPLAAAVASRSLGAEQSNTSILYSDGAGPCAVLKLFRRLQAGENPDYEVPRALAQQGNFRQVPAALGRIVYHPADGVATTLASLSQFIPNQGDGWAFVQARLTAGAGASLLPELAQLGRRTAELHLALAGVDSDPGFAPESITAADLEFWRQRALAGVDAPSLAPYADELKAWRQRLRTAEPLAGLAGLAKIRIHGDFHLGQVLKTADDFYIFDFEGEPARPIEVRRQKGCVLQDVAGLLRSLDYAAQAAGVPGWEPAARQAFLAAYRAALAPAPLPLVPASEAGWNAARGFFEQEKAVYELSYELAHRPDWAAIPLARLRGASA